MEEIEKRRMTRFTLKLPAWFSTRCPDGKQKTYEFQTRDVSAAGAYLLPSQPLTVGTRVNLSLILTPGTRGQDNGGGAQIAVEGEVIRAEKGGLAVCFAKKYRITPLNVEFS